MAIDKCVKCGRSIQEFLTGRKEIDGKLYCSDDYYKELGKMVEESPIGTKRTNK